jgi:hypothetical protein
VEMGYGSGRRSREEAGEDKAGPEPEHGGGTAVAAERAASARGTLEYDLCDCSYMDHGLVLRHPILFCCQV